LHGVPVWLTDKRYLFRNEGGNGKCAADGGGGVLSSIAGKRFPAMLDNVIELCWKALSSYAGKRCRAMLESVIQLCRTKILEPPEAASRKGLQRKSRRERSGRGIAAESPVDARRAAMRPNLFFFFLFDW
jgi:hypothetical protein